MFVAKHVSAETPQPSTLAAKRNHLRGADWDEAALDYLRRARAHRPPVPYRLIADVLGRDESACRIKACKIAASKPNRLRGKAAKPNPSRGKAARGQR